MRSIVVAVPAVVVLWSLPARAADWTDVPALLAEATAKVEPAVRACTRLPKRIALIASRTRRGTRVAMPMPAVGTRGLTPEERCLIAAIARVALPPLPAEIDRVVLGRTFGAPVPAFGDWRDPAKTLATVLDPGRRAALAACDRRPRTVRITLDLRAGRTRVWLPAWQFHAPSGDGTTPPRERRVKACLAKVIRSWRPPALPPAMAELQLAIRTRP